MISVLYNNCYGGFSFSAAFNEEYKARAGKYVDTYKALFRQGSESIRCDPTAIAIFKKEGSEWCSGPNSLLEIYEVPLAFANYWEIEEYDGDEHVRVLVADAFADILHTFMESNDRQTLDKQYANLVEATDVLKTGPVTAGEVDGSGPKGEGQGQGYGFFDSGCP
jgi:hypothetical protein